MVWHVPTAWRTDWLYPGNRFIPPAECLYVGTGLYDMGLADSIYLQCNSGVGRFVYPFKTA